MANPDNTYNKDSEVVALMESNPQAGFAKLFDMYYEEVCRHVYNYVPDQKIVEDITQDLFAELWSKRDSLKISSSILLPGTISM